MTKIPDTTKTYVTRDGRKVILHEVVLHNSAGEAVTFPVKGTIIETLPSGRRRTTYNIWQMSGRSFVLAEHSQDIINLEYV